MNETQVIQAVLFGISLLSLSSALVLAYLDWLWEIS